jgi:hypothetical protein
VRMVVMRLRRSSQHRRPPSCSSSPFSGKAWVGFHLIGAFRGRELLFHGDLQAKKQKDKIVLFFHKYKRNN